MFATANDAGLKEKLAVAMISCATNAASQLRTTILTLSLTVWGETLLASSARSSTLGKRTGETVYGK